MGLDAGGGADEGAHGGQMEENDADPAGDGGDLLIQCDVDWPDNLLAAVVSITDYKSKFVCLSFDYYTQGGECDLSEANAESVGGLKTNYQGNPYDHYEMVVDAPSPVPPPCALESVSERDDLTQAMA